MNIVRLSAAVLASALSFGGYAWAPNAVAQGYGAQQQPQGQQRQQQISPSENEIAAFAEARQAVQEVSREYQPRLESAGSAEDQQSIRRQATQEMVEAIEETGISVRKYNQITEAMRNDADLAEKVRNQMQ